MAEITAICISEQKGTKKHEVPFAELITEHGILGDAHAGRWHRQVSMLSDEDVDTMRARGAVLSPGDFGENLLTRGISLTSLAVLTRVQVGSAVLEITQIGKECHSECEIKRMVGTCVMPTRGVFARVITGGIIRKGDRIEVIA